MAIEVFGQAVEKAVDSEHIQELLEPLRQNIIEQARYDWGKEALVEFHDTFVRVKLYSHFEDVPL